MTRSWHIAAHTFAWCLLAAGILASAFPAAAFAQKNSSPPSFLLGTVPADPGVSIAVPLYFTPGAGQPVHTAHLEVEFVSNSVKFDKAEKGVASAVEDFDITVNAKELPPDKNIHRTHLDIDVALANVDAKKSLPEGLLAFLNFQVPTDAKSFSIELKPVAFSALDAAKKTVKVAAESGKIIVSLPDVPMVGCFFFTH